MATHTSPKLLLRRALHRFGYDIVRFRGAHRAGYATIAPHATYAPWLKDAA
jgi:hypothetical protein